MSPSNTTWRVSFGGSYEVSVLSASVGRPSCHRCACLIVCAVSLAAVGYLPHGIRGQHDAHTFGDEPGHEDVRHRKEHRDAGHHETDADFVIKDTQPVFFFRFVDQKEMSKLAQTDPMAAMAMMNGSGGGMLMGNNAKDYVLAKLQVDGDARVASSKGMETVKLQITKKSPLEFEVRPLTPLAPGQYAFFMGAMGGAPSQIYAFTVK